MPENGYTMSDSAHPTQISRRDMLKGLVVEQSESLSYRR